MIVILINMQNRKEKATKSSIFKDFKNSQQLIINKVLVMTFLRK